jgi:hypothetical protein
MSDAETVEWMRTRNPDWIREAPPNGSAAVADSRTSGAITDHDKRMHLSVVDVDAPWKVAEHHAEANRRLLPNDEDRAQSHNWKKIAQ